MLPASYSFCQDLDPYSKRHGKQGAGVAATWVAWHMSLFLVEVRRQLRDAHEAPLHFDRVDFSNRFEVL